MIWLVDVCEQNNKHSVLPCCMKKGIFSPGFSIFLLLFSTSLYIDYSLRLSKLIEFWHVSTRNGIELISNSGIVWMFEVCKKRGCMMHETSCQLCITTSLDPHIANRRLSPATWAFNSTINWISWHFIIAESGSFSFCLLFTIYNCKPFLDSSRV